MLGRTYRFQILNSTGQTLAASVNTITARREKRGSDGSLTFESSETTVFSNGSTQATGTYANGSTIDNSTDEWEGGAFTVSITAPASSSGDVVVRLQRSTDAGTTWPDDGTGTIVRVINFTTSGTKKRNFYL